MEDAKEFIDHYRPLLLLYLDGRNGEQPEQAGPLEFVEEVLSSWANFAADRMLNAPNLEERTFWFALYQLEELVEYPAMEKLDPYEGILMQNLAEVREHLRIGAPLPDIFFATRPGEDPDAL